MPPEDMRVVRDLGLHRRARGLTQTDLALLLGVTQQAVAKWEQSGAVPHHRLPALAKHLRVPIEILLPPGGRTSPDHGPRVRAVMNELFADQVVVSFDTANFHYCPSSEEVHAFWSDLQRGPFAQLSAGPVQAMINVDAIRRIDFSEEPDLNLYTPFPRSPIELDADEDPEQVRDEEAHLAPWFVRGEARAFVRGVAEPYTGPQDFFADTLERDDVTKEELAELHDAFECERPSQNSLFDLFDNLAFHSDMDPDPSDRSDPTHPGHLHVFQSEDDEGGPRNTWVHTRDLLLVEVPTRLWEIHRLSVRARLELMDREERKQPKRRSRKRSA